MIWLLACTCARTEAPTLAEPAPKVETSTTVADDGLLAGAPAPIERLELSMALWGVSVPNAVKGLPLAYDAKTDRLYHASITTDWLIATDLDKGHPVDAVNLELENASNIANVQARDGVLSWVNSKAHEVRVVDLETMTLKGRVDIEGRNQKGIPTASCTLDADGLTWVVDAQARTVSGHDPTCSRTVTLDEIRSPVAIASSPDGKTLAVLDGGREGGTAYLYRDQQLTPVKEFPSKLPRRVAVTDDGTLLIADKRLMSVPSDGSAGFTLPLPDSPRRLAVVGDVVVATFADTGFEDGRPGGHVWLVEVGTGDVRAKLETGYETLNIATDPDGGRCWVGQGGDGSVAEIDVENGVVTREIPIASGAEGLVVDAQNEDRYILSRLGGSAVYKWAADGTFTTLAEPMWPFEIAIDSDRRLLMAATHYESGLTLWNLDTGAERKIAIPGEISTGDAIGDLEYDAATGRAAVVYPQHGTVTVLDVTTGRVIWQKTYEEFATGRDAGPGEGLVTFTPTHVVVAWGRSVVLGLDPETGEELRRQELRAGAVKGDGKEGKVPKGDRPPKGEKPPLDDDRPLKGEKKPPKDGIPKSERPPKTPKMDKPPKGQRSKAETGKGAKAASGDVHQADLSPSRGYPMDALVYDAVGNRVFLGNRVLDGTTLDPVDEAPFDKLVYADGERILGVAIDRDRREALVICAPDLTKLEVVPLIQARMIPAHYTYDARTRKLYAAHLDRAQVTVWQLD